MFLSLFSIMFIVAPPPKLPFKRRFSKKPRNKDEYLLKAGSHSSVYVPLLALSISNYIYIFQSFYISIYLSIYIYLFLSLYEKIKRK